MHIDPYIVLGSAVVGMLVGLTGAGGGALMTPMLILLFGITPSSAISSDLVAAVLMRPVGALVHLRKGTVNLRMVGWMVLGSVPMAFLGSFLLKELGADSDAAQTKVEIVLGTALLIGAGAMVLRYVLDRRSGNQRLATIAEITVKPVPTIAIGAVGGLIVGLTSVGSGSLMIVLLLFLYPMIGANQLVGTDLSQAVPLTAAAALGALIFGHVEFAVTLSIVIGSVPAVLIGSYLSSRAPDKFIRPIITFVIFASGLKYVGVGTTALGWILVVVALGAMGAWLFLARPWNNSESKKPAAVAATAGAGAGAGMASPNGHATVTPTANGSKSVNGAGVSVNGHSAQTEPETTGHSADPPENAGKPESATPEATAAPDPS
ncbi:MAG TPA: sulfite exporter TauE/SafE family protein [Streptosporangiaceae bacterium]|nr:sulfite exporter TauE/SafE family protein [Streptosporangiaceae bacterium]